MKKYLLIFIFGIILCRIGYCDFSVNALYGEYTNGKKIDWKIFLRKWPFLGYACNQCEESSFYLARKYPHDSILWNFDFNYSIPGKARKAVIRLKTPSGLLTYIPPSSPLSRDNYQEEFGAYRGWIYLPREFKVPWEKIMDRKLTLILEVWIGKKKITNSISFLITRKRVFDSGIADYHDKFGQPEYLRKYPIPVRLPNTYWRYYLDELDRMGYYHYSGQ
jgi:hypothetical protein